MRYRGFAIPVISLLLSAVALAVTPQFWENFSQEELLKGTLSRVSLSSEGKLLLAPAYDLYYDTGQPYIFSMVRDKSGNIYLGTGHEGKVFKVDPQGNGSVYFQSGELDIFALALDSTDILYVGTSPDGKVYKVSGPGQSTEFCNPEEKYIWSLIFDDSGNLYAGTGGRGIIYKVDRSGKKSTFYDGDDNHIVSLARAAGGNLLAGTSPNGLVLDINPQGKAYTLLDSPMEEIRALTQDRFGTVYAVASSSKGLTLPLGPAKTETPTEEGGIVLPVVTIQALSGLSDQSKDSKTAVSAPGGDKDSAGSKSSIYVISKDGAAEILYTSKDQMVYDALVRPDGSLLAASGGRGRLLSIDSAKQVTVVTDSPEEQSTRLLAAADNVFVSGSNQGKVYKLQSRPAETGSYESRVLDARSVSTWGKIAWVLNGTTGGVELSSRSGNTEKPDSSWSSWSSSYTTASGQQITSPNARYFQWKASFRRGSGGAIPDLLERVRIAYLQQNLRPQLLSINLLTPGIALQKNPVIPGTTLSVGSTGTDGSPPNSPRERGKEKQPLPPRQVAQPGAQAFTWKASDENDDSLEYSIYFKGEGETDWKLMEKKITDTFYTVEGGSLPDGVYTVKVVASDAPSNPYGKFLIGELISRPFIINNSTPQVEILGHKIDGKRVEVQFRAKVGTGRIASVEFSIDGGEWFLVFPTDGIADSPVEDFQMTTPELSPGEHIVGFRAGDSTGNTGTAKLLVRIQ